MLVDPGIKLIQQLIMSRVKFLSSCSAFQSLEKGKIDGEKKNSRGEEGKEKRREMLAVKRW